MSYTITDSQQEIAEVKANEFLPQSVKDACNPTPYVAARSNNEAEFDIDFSLTDKAATVCLTLNTFMADVRAYIPVPVMRRMAQWILDNTKETEA